MSSRTTSILRWTSLALAGLAIALAVGIAAGKLTSQRIGLSAESLQAGEALAPKPTGRQGKDHGGGGEQHGGGDLGGGSTTTTPTTTATTSTTAPPTTATAPPSTTTAPPTTSGGSDDYGGGNAGDD